MIRRFIFISWQYWVGLALLFLPSNSFAFDPDILYLTWTHDPMTTMVVQWHSPNDETSSQIFYRKIDQETWDLEQGSFKILHNTAKLVHAVELTHLQPGADYEFHFESETKTYRFRTLPSHPSSPLRFAVGGDAYYFLSTFKKMNRKIVSHDPDFIVIGGDIAYAYSRKLVFKKSHEDVRRWLIFFKEWKKKMVTSDGRLIPLLPVIGNHDIDPFGKEVYFFELFEMPHETCAYRALDIGNVLSFIFLDSGHYSAVGGDQTLWLEKALQEREDVFLTLPIYHVAAYPSAYPFNGERPTLIRAHWVPLFENYHVKFAFEHHNHTFKRTHPIKDKQIDPTGVIYLGDGAWGVSPRAPHLPSTRNWYLAKTKKTNCFWLVTLQRQNALFQAFNLKGKLIDEFNFCK
jgi:acid phosphatase type 7